MMGIFGFGKKAEDPKPNQQKPADASSTVPDFDVLASQLQANNDRESMEKLWDAAFALHEWFFIPRGELPNVHPFVGVIEGKAFVNAFTDHHKAHDFAILQGFVSRDDPAHVLSMPVAGFIDTVPFYVQQGVFGLLFNDGPSNFFAPLQNLRPMFLYHQAKRGSGPVSS